MPGKGERERSIKHKVNGKLVLVFGDQLNADSAVFDDFDPQRDAVLMIEAAREATYVPQHKHRLILFFSAMRHFRDGLRDRGYTVHYAALSDRNNRGSFRKELPRWVHKTGTKALIATQPGDHRIQAELWEALRNEDCALEIRPDRHFMCSDEAFRAVAHGKKRLVLETFYRAMRRHYRILLDSKGNPTGGKWNYDADNRGRFGKDGPPDIKTPYSFSWDDTTMAVAKLVEKRFQESPGKAERFDYPVSTEQAYTALDDFVTHRLADFGQYQDAMAAGHPYLYHSRLSSSLNLHLLDPRDAIAKAVQAYENGDAPLNSVEGFVRQILGWREYIRGIYWREMPDYERQNELEADLPMPALLWTADTEMNCIRQCVGQLIEHAYTHHIQRLMVLGLFCLLLGVRPQEVNCWHHSMYIDAIDWVSLPNVIGMSQYADGGLLATKPYCASGAYIQRMSNYCQGCRFNPRKATGENACPFTTLYWDFLSRNRKRLKTNQRMNYQFANLDKKSPSQRHVIHKQADQLKSKITKDTWL